MKEKISFLAVILAVMAGPALLAWYAFAYRPSTYPPQTRVINLTGIARRGVWTLETVHNLNYWWKAFEPATIQLPLDARVVLRLHSADVVHQFYLPALRVGPVDVEPGHVTEVRFHADREGTYQYFCTSLCGDCHFYMSGWVVVTAPGKTPEHPAPIVCPRCIPQPPPPSDQGIVAHGEYLYGQHACGACHGIEGRGGVANYNYLNGTIIDHVHLATRLFLRDEPSAEALIAWMEKNPDLRKADEEPDVSAFALVKARMEAALTLMREGKNAAKADLNGPEPPLQMPAWKNKINEPELAAIVAYLVSLNPWEEEEGEAEGDTGRYNQTASNKNQF